MLPLVKFKWTRNYTLLYCFQVLHSGPVFFLIGDTDQAVHFNYLQTWAVTQEHGGTYNDIYLKIMPFGTYVFLNKFI